VSKRSAALTIPGQPVRSEITTKQLAIFRMRL
jgi:hypothetical protein